MGREEDGLSRGTLSRDYVERGNTIGVLFFWGFFFFSFDISLQLADQMMPSGNCTRRLALREVGGPRLELPRAAPGRNPAGGELSETGWEARARADPRGTRTGEGESETE